MKIDPEKLTPDQKFAICAAAGVPIESEFKDGKLTMKTRHPCGIASVGGGIVVMVNERFSGGDREKK